jgi:2-oxoglutarate dehydrogenase E2 component (dihydrolipoamide succinyltransferase)
MKVEIKVPPMGESISEATIGSFLKPNGSAVKESEEVIELETEKVNQPLYAPANGEVTWTVLEGDTVTIGAVIGFVDTEKKGEAVAEEVVPPPESTPAPELTPAPKKPEGEIRKGVDSFIANLEEKEAPAPKTALPTGQRESRTKMSRIRKTIANRLVDSLHEAAMLTTFNEVDMSCVMAMRAKYKESFLEQIAPRPHILWLLLYPQNLNTLVLTQ